jgi:3-deoxy-D-manno-octulosonic-acid transferase
MARSMPVSIAGYLPWDIRSEMGDLLDVLDPQLISFTKTEVWPGLTTAAIAHGVPVVLAAATLPASAGRLRTPGRLLLRPTFEALSAVCAISEKDGERFLRLGVPAERIEVTGDPGVDSAWQRVREANLQSPHLAPFVTDPAPTLVAGSTWPEDEKVLLPTLREMRERESGFRVVIAPHEPEEPHLKLLEEGLLAAGFRTVRLDEVEERGSIGDADAIVVNRVGVLAQLYRIGSVAFVGGGFGTNGLHSVLEPAAAGIPSLFGPHHSNSLASSELVRIGGARVGHDSGEMIQILGTWFRDLLPMEEAGTSASGYIEEHRGASLRTARILDRYVPASYGATH